MTLGVEKLLVADNVEQSANKTCDVAPSAQSQPIQTSTNGGVQGPFKPICRRVRTRYKENLRPLIELAVEIAREGREGRRIGTLFTFGDADAVLKHSRPVDPRSTRRAH